MSPSQDLFFAEFSDILRQSSLRRQDDRCERCFVVDGLLFSFGIRSTPMIMYVGWSGVACFTIHVILSNQVIPMAKKQLGLWGLDYFDLFLIHFPIALEYVDPDHRYPPEWFGDDGKVHTGEYQGCQGSSVFNKRSSKCSHPRDLGSHGRVGGRRVGEEHWSEVHKGTVKLSVHRYSPTLLLATFRERPFLTFFVMRGLNLKSSKWNSIHTWRKRASWSWHTRLVSL